MSNQRPLSRRRFATALGSGLGAALFQPRFVPSAEASLPKEAPEDAIQLNSNENPYGPSDRAVEAVRRAQGVASRYPDAAEGRLMEALAARHRVEPDRIVLGCGSGEVLQMADMAFLGPGQAVVVSEPTFEAVLGYAQVTRAEPVKVAQTADFRHDLPRMAAACQAGAGLVYVCNPNNPTGTIVDRDELGRFLERVPSSTTVLVDEAYHHFVEDPRYSSAEEWLERAANLVIVRTFSKIYGMAGLRLGYAVGSRERIEAMRAHATWNNANAAALDGALASLSDRDHVARQRALNSRTRAWLCRELDKDGRRFIPSHTNFLMLEAGTDVQPLIAAFAERRILVGRKFPSMDRWLRVSIGTRREMEAFLRTLRAILPAGRAAAQTFWTS